MNYEEKPYSKHPKAKIAYHVDCGHLFTIDTVTYSNFPLNADSLIAASADEAKIKSGSPFDVVSLDAERNRLSNLFRNNGYYYYQPSYASYRADTVNTPGKVKLDVELADNLPEKALKKWYIGNISINLRRTFMEELKELAKGDDQILFTGFVQGTMLDELYSNAYIYTLPSDLEGMPLSLLEAMSYGNCCLVSDIPECAEVVEDKALIFKKSDVEDLREKLQDACDHPEMVMKMKNQAADFICEKYNWDEVVKETMKLYRRK